MLLLIYSLWKNECKIANDEFKQDGVSGVKLFQDNVLSKYWKIQNPANFFILGKYVFKCFL